VVVASDVGRGAEHAPVVQAIVVAQSVRMVQPAQSTGHAAPFESKGDALAERKPCQRPGKPSGARPRERESLQTRGSADSGVIGANNHPGVGDLVPHHRGTPEAKFGKSAAAADPSGEATAF
jgi:hypothetical protein